jgi:apolipoprotein N-acyltransferase
MTRLFALALSSAALISVAHRPWGAGYLAWIALVPLLTLLVTEKRWWRGALAGWLAALGTGLVAFEGVAPAEFWAYPILVVIAGIPWAIAGALLVSISTRLGRGAALWLFPVLLVAAEFIPAQRALLGDFANGMSAFGYTQFGTPLLAAAGWSGVSGVSFLVIGLNVALYCVWQRRPAPAVTWLALALMAALIPVPGGNTPNPEPAPLRVAVAQGSVSSVDTLLARFDREAAQRMVSPYADLTAQATAHGADLVVWGETVLPHAIRPGHVPDYLAEALAPAPLALVGGVAYTNGSSYNSIFHWEDGVLAEVYRKRALVPFNERHYTPGRALPPLAVNDVSVGLGICLDSVFGSLARESVRAGAELLVYVTEDSFAVRTVTPELHLRVTAFRAVESGRYVVFANQSGPSAVFDQRGRIVERLEHGAVAGLITPVPALRGVTPFVRFGDWIGTLSTLLVVSAALYLLVTALQAGHSWWGKQQPAYSTRSKL